MVTVGVDLHKHVSQIAVLKASGEVVQHRLDNDPEKVAQFFSEIPAPAQVAIEASATWWWFVDLLERLDMHPCSRTPSKQKPLPRLA